ncbi:MAG TPA: FkbM family methyltransferase [Solirubrobacteraceae bacterium]|jgi:FkbM family methyltransferase|nr:FkbM family methyltransferase [Solirubrobacteraceae bacterium]
MVDDLIFDVGFHNGEDTEHYLSKGFRVVAVEANPVLVSQGRQRFAREIADERLIIEDAAVAPENGSIELWVNESNDEWSSIDRSVGSRDGSGRGAVSVSAATGRAHPVEVNAVRFDALLARHGVPYYLKIDIERADFHCLRALDPDHLPRYLSIEAHALEYFCALHELGYREFKCVDQERHNLRPMPLTNETVAGRAARTVAHYTTAAQRELRRRMRLSEGRFPMGGSGPFGEDTPGPWLPLEDAVYDWLHWHRRAKNRGSLNMYSWYDIHVRRADSP